jgi:hypothetical protein
VKQINHFDTAPFKFNGNIESVDVKCLMLEK